MTDDYIVTIPAENLEIVLLTFKEEDPLLAERNLEDMKLAFNKRFNLVDGVYSLTDAEFQKFIHEQEMIGVDKAIIDLMREGKIDVFWNEEKQEFGFATARGIDYRTGNSTGINYEDT